MIAGRAQLWPFELMSWRRAIPLLLVLGAAALYLSRLVDAPFYLGRDEMFFGLSGHALAHTGRDSNGRFLPLYIQSPMRYGSDMWFQPLLMYSSAAAVRLFGLDEGTIRLPMAIAGVADILLVFLIGRRLFKNDLLAIAAAALLAFAPAHLIHARVAMDFQAPLPFMLGWFLCVLLYLEHGRGRDLFLAGVALGLGLYTYIASYMIMPVLGLFTAVVLYHRRDAVPRYALLAAGFLIPLILCIVFVLQHPTVIRDVMWHYDRDQPHEATATNLLARYFGYQRFVDAARVYWAFWNPRFLFVTGPGHVTWAAGVYLVPMAGAMLVGLVHTLRRPSAPRLLVLGALLLSPIPASFVGDLDAVHRASGVLPFGALLAGIGLHSLWQTTRTFPAVVGFCALWVIPVLIASTHHALLPMAQTLIRAMTAALGMAGLTALWQAAPRVTLFSKATAVIVPTAIVICLIAYRLLGYGTAVWLSVAIGAVAWWAWLRHGDSQSRVDPQSVVAAMIAIACCHLTYGYSDYTRLSRIGVVPASVVAAAVTLVASTMAFAAVASARAAARSSAVVTRTAAAALVAAWVVVQMVYSQMAYFADHRLRVMQVIAVMAAAAAIASVALRVGSARALLGPFAAVAMLGAASVQFVYVYEDYFTRFRDRAENFDHEGYARIAFEKVIEQVQQQPAPAIHLAAVGPYGFADLYWQFYTLKYHRPDLIAQTTSAQHFEPDRVRALPYGSLVVTGQSPAIDRDIAALVDSGAIAAHTLLTAPDGRSRFWILETRRPAGF